MTEILQPGIRGTAGQIRRCSLGYTNQYYFTRSGKAVAPGDADNVVSFDVSAGRRQASPAKKMAIICRRNFRLVTFSTMIGR